MIKTHFVDDLVVSVDTMHSFSVRNAYGEVSFRYEYDPQTEIHLNQWIGYTPDEDAKAIYRFLLRFATEHGFSMRKNVSDTSAMEGSFDGITDWLLHEHVPRAVKAGFKYAAVVLPKDFFTQVSVNNLREREAEQAYISNYFDSQVAARAWLVEQP